MMIMAMMFHVRSPARLRWVQFGLPAGEHNTTVIYINKFGLSVSPFSELMSIYIWQTLVWRMNCLLRRKQEKEQERLQNRRSKNTRRNKEKFHMWLITDKRVTVCNQGRRYNCAKSNKVTLKMNWILSPKKDNKPGK
jgi:hypothetical protein